MFCPHVFLISLVSDSIRFPRTLIQFPADFLFYFFLFYFQILPGLHLGAVWQGAGGAAKREDSLLPAESVWCGQIICILVSFANLDKFAFLKYLTAIHCNVYKRLLNAMNVVSLLNFYYSGFHLISFPLHTEIRGLNKSLVKQQ